MKDFETSLNSLLVDTFNLILKYEELSLKSISGGPVTISEAHMIEAISAQNTDVTVSTLADSLNIAPPTVTVAIKKLEKKGLVQKTPSTTDGRRFYLHLTETGQKIARAHQIFHTRMVRNISSQFPEEEKATLLAAVNKLNEFFAAKVEA